MKKNSKFSSILVIVIGMVLIAGIIFYGISVDSKRIKIFNPTKASAAEKLYGDVLNRDLISDYPSDVEELIEFNNGILKLIYGDMLLDDTYLKDILLKQRELFSDTLLEGNDFDTTYENLLKDLAELKEKGIFTISMTLENPIYDPFDQTTCKIPVRQYTNIGEIDWEYNLVRNENGRWKINSWRYINSKDLEQDEKTSYKE